MNKIILFLQVFLFIISANCFGQSLSKADQEILHTFWSYASEHHLEDEPVNNRIPVIASFFLNSPYKSNILNTSCKETLIINLREFDCVTFVENVLALAYLKKYDDRSIHAFIKNLMQIRYRKGIIEDYTSRLHYSSDWFYEMQKQHLLTDITLSAGGVHFQPDLYFMSKNYTHYLPLQNNKALQIKIKNIETEINKRTYYHIPKANLKEACNHIKNGDIILITTNIKGLDTSHLGIALKKDGKTYLLHASSNEKKVVISEVPLQEYMINISSQSGIMIGRALNWHKN